MKKNNKWFTPHPSQKDGVNIPVNFSRKKGAGFTLIELLIVIAIITILAAAVVVGINPTRHFKNARNATRYTQMNTIVSAVYSYAVEHNGDFPTGCIGVEGSPIDIDASWCPDLVPDYIHSIPDPPQSSTGEKYQIQYDGDAVKITSTAEEAYNNTPPVQVIQ